MTAVRQGGTEAAVAERLYYDSPALEFSATVTDIRLVATEKSDRGVQSHVWQVALDRTAFYPESGGQPWDTGVLTATARSGATLEVAVERVVEDDAGEVWHQIRKPLEQGTALVGRVDGARRQDHAQQHSGQHLLSAVFLQQLGARTVSFHLGGEGVTIDLALPEGTGALTFQQFQGVEDEVNRLIYQDRHLAPRWYTRDEAEAMLARGELRKLPERPGPMRVVEMQGVEFNACGGTHVASTGAIGGLLLRGTEKVKAGVRVEFVCGLRAVHAARQEYGVLTEVAKALSTAKAEVFGRVLALQEENRLAAKRQRGLLEELAAAKGLELAAAADQDVVEAIFESKPLEFAKRVASTVVEHGRATALVGSLEGEQGTVVLAFRRGEGRHAGNLLREVAAGLGFRGGGSADLAQGVCGAAQVQQLMHALKARLA